MKKNKIIGILATLGCAAVAAGAGLITPVTAKAEDTYIGDVAVKSQERSFVMQEGASVRYKTSDGKNGIRFKADLTEAAYTELEAKDNESDAIAVNYGMLLVPYDYVKTTEWDVDTLLNGTNTYYTLAACTAEGDDACACNIKHVTGVTAATLAVSGGKATIVGSLVNLLAGNINREFVGIAYIEYDGGTEKTYVVADYYGNDIENNTRSMTYVAQLYLQDEKQDETHELYVTYVEPLESKEHKYTVEHYIPDGAGGYTKKLTETKWGAINQSVSAANIAKVDGATYGEWATAVMNADENALVSSPLFVNGNTVLKCYYEKVDTTLFDSADTNDVSLLYNANVGDEASYSRISTVETAADPTNESKTVVKVSSTDKYPWGDGLLDMNFNVDKLQLANDGNWDYLTVRMYIDAAYEKGVYYTDVADEYLANEETAIESISTVEFFNHNHLLGKYAVNEWVDVIIPKAKLNATYYKADGTVDKTSLLLQKNPSETKEGFDKLFTDHYSGNGSSQLFNVGNFSTTKFISKAGITKPDAACHDVRITYYIDTITWGVDYTAPEIQASTEILTAAADGTAISYTPAYSVTDDIIPAFMTAASGAQHNCLIEYSHIVYDKATGKEATKNEDGSYALTKGSDYVLSVTASDWSVTDIPGNTVTKEFDLVYITTKTITSFDSEQDVDYITSDTSAVIYGRSYLPDYLDKEGVVKLETSMKPTTSNNGGGELRFNFFNSAEEIYNAFMNNEDFSLTMTICFNFECSSQYKDMGVDPYFGVKYKHAVTEGITVVDSDGDAVTSNMLIDQWYTITFTKQALIEACGWADTIKNQVVTKTQKENIINELNGSQCFLSFSDFSVLMTEAGTPVTFYLDEISYSIA